MKGKTLLISFYLFICTGDTGSGKLAGKFNIKLFQLQKKKNNNKK